MSTDRDDQSELECLRATCWRQAAQIRSLEDTVSVLRVGANELALDNAELHTEIECLSAGEPVLPSPSTAIRLPRRSGSRRTRHDAARC